jgi:hypothetical protein
MASVNLSDMVKPVMLVEATAKSKSADVRSKMMLRAVQRWRMNVGDPNRAV